jgi:hypothetical protein
LSARPESLKVIAGKVCFFLRAYAIATTAVISDLVQTREGNETVTTPTRRWEVFSYGWQPQMILPQWPLEKRADPAKHRVEVKYIGSSTSNAVNTLDFATHVTHASTDF